MGNFHTHADTENARVHGVLLVHGSDIRAARKKKGWSQRELGKRAGLSREAIRYWERKGTIIPRNPNEGPARIGRSLDLDGLCFTADYSQKRSQARLDFEQAKLDRSADVMHATIHHQRICEDETRRVICDAETRCGRSCQLVSEKGKRRCRFHGGRSTGPRTPEGKARIAEVQRQRWRNFREASSAM